MRSHHCNITDAWEDGTVNECGCARYRRHGRGSVNRTGYKNKTHVYHPEGWKRAKQREHFDGSLDAKVQPEPVRGRFGME